MKIGATLSSVNDMMISSSSSYLLDPLTNSIISNNMIIDKLRRNLKTRNMTIQDLCGQGDGDDPKGFANIIEFKNCLRRIGVNSREVDMILEMVVMNKEGMIDL